MLTNNDCILLLYDLETKGVKDTEKYVSKALGKQQIDLDVLKFIHINMLERI